jgi:hypothetical protein
LTDSETHGPGTLCGMSHRLPIARIDIVRLVQSDVPARWLCMRFPVCECPYPSMREWLQRQCLMRHSQSALRISTPCWSSLTCADWTLECCLVCRSCMCYAETACACSLVCIVPTCICEVNFVNEARAWLPRGMCKYHPRLHKSTHSLPTTTAFSPTHSRHS